MLFRTERDPTPLPDLARETTVFAALWPEAATEGFGGDAALPRRLAAAHTDAPAWFDLLADDETFVALGRATAVFQPTRDEIEAFTEAPAEAWRPLDGLIQRALNYGLALLDKRH